MGTLTVTVRIRHPGGEWETVKNHAQVDQVTVEVHSTDATGNFRVLSDGDGEVVIECSDPRARRSLTIR